MILFVFELEAAKRPCVQTQNELAQLPSLQPLTIIIKIDKNTKKGKKK